MAPKNPLPIAIVGMSCRFPGGANDTERFWSMLSDGKSAWSDVPPDRFNWTSFYHPNPDINGATNHRGGHFLSQDISAFDAGFFGISPSEAHSMDPQHRLQLETAYEALENAGVTLDQARGSKTAVYVAIFGRDYNCIMNKDTTDFAKYHMTGVGDSIVSNRISYTFDLKGPSMTLDTGCSGGLVALHQACQGLRTEESNMALVGGTNLILSPDSMISMSLLHVLNSDGKCYPFDSRGSGYGRGEGAATLVLKRLDDALQAGDCIRGVIRHTGINQDGKTAGITVPDQLAQEKLVREMYWHLNIDPLDVHFVEAHGTGTVAGDAAELKSISSVFCSGRQTENPLFVGTVKSNIGHLESVSGLAGLIKTILVLEKGFIPPNINFEKIKSGLTDETQHIKFPLILEPLPCNSDGSRYASVNSFGYGGTNAHAILEAAPTKLTRVTTNGHRNGIPAINDRLQENGNLDWKVQANDHAEDLTVATKDAGNTPPDCRNGSVDGVTKKGKPTSMAPQLLVLTAKSKTSLLKRIGNLAEWVSERPQNDVDLKDLAFTLSCRRSHMLWRYSIIVNSPQDLFPVLTHQDPQVTKVSNNIRLTYLFTGQGAQWFAMGRELIFAAPRFKESLAHSDNILRGFGSPWSLMDELLFSKSASRIDESQIAQPASTAIQIALVDLLCSLGIQPNTVLGHSSGEIAAAYAAGALSQDMALRVSYYRGFIIKDQPMHTKGAMLAVGLGEREASIYLSQLQKGTVCVACVNSPASTTISGDETAIDELKAILEDQRVFTRKLKVGIAYHSHHVQEGAARYLHSLEGLEFGQPRPSVKFISSVTATEKSDNFGPSYWVQNLTSKVRFSDSIVELYRDQQADSRLTTDCMQSLIEIGPHSALSGSTHQTLAQLSPNSFNYSYQPSLLRDRDCVHSMLTLCGKLFELGYPICLQTVALLTGSKHNRNVIRDLPSYHWDHSHKYWHESRLSSEYRLRLHPQHDLLGVQIPGGTPFEPTWRNVLNVENLPWLHDHVVDNSMIFPGSGYLCMAVEAIRQGFWDRQSSSIIRCFVVRDVVFSKALLIPEAPGKVEIQLSLRPLKIGNVRNSTGWNDFRIFSLSTEGVWNENCHGSIMAEFSPSTDDVDEFSEESHTTKAQSEEFNSLRNRTLQYLDPGQLYQSLRWNGNNYGPMFAALRDLKIGDREALGTVVIPDIAACMPLGFMQSHVIHPATLDALFHVNLPLFLRHCSPGSALPLSIEEVIIPANVINTPGQQFLVAGKIIPEGPRSARTYVLAFPMIEGKHSTPPISISNGEMYGLGEIQTVHSGTLWERSMTYHMEWDLDVEFVTQDTLDFPDQTRQRAACRGTKLSQEQKVDLLDRAASLYINKSLMRIVQQSWTVPHKHNGYLLAWMQRYSQSESGRRLTHGMDETAIANTLLEAQQAGVEGEILTRVGQNLALILAGMVDPLTLLLEGGLLYRFYAEESSSVQCCSYLIRYLKHLIFKNPYMTILEIGAGTGGTTLSLLRALTREERPLFAQYDFTDVSTGFFEPAQTLLQEWSTKVRFKTLDIERDPITQGFVKESYDLIIASNVLHATTSMDETVANVRQLLKPGGRLALIEITRPHPFWNTVFGVLPGWWNGFDEGRQDGPLLSTELWDQLLSRNLFTGVEITTKDFEGSSNSMTMMISRSLLQKESSASTPVKICFDSALGDYCSEFAAHLRSTLEGDGFDTGFASWPSDDVSEEVIYVILDPGVSSLLANPSVERFAQVCRLVTQAKQILWITTQDGNAAAPSLEKSLITGFARSARSENETLQLVTLDIGQSITQADSHIIKAICEVLSASFGSSSGNRTTLETEYALREDRLFIPRLIPNTQINRIITGLDRTPKPDLSLFHQPHHSLKLHVEKPGLLDSLVFQDFTPRGLQEDELEIEVRAFGINFRDVFVALGQMKDSTTMVGECAGVVTAVGSSCQVRFRVGDRVCAWFATPYASHAHVRWSNASRIPDTMSFVVAASIPMVFLTAHYSLVEIAKIQRGQTILIHSAAGGVGQAAIMIAQLFGAKVFATIGRPSKRSVLMEKFGIPESHIFSSRSRSFKKRLLQMTDGEGVDIILNSLSGEALLDSWDCIANFGTFVELGKADIYRNSQINMKPFDKNVTFASLDLIGVGDRRPEKLCSIFDKVMSMFEAGVLTVVHPITTMSIANVEDAFRLIQARKHTGKVVLEVEKGARVKAIPPRSEPLRLDADGTYVVAGGLGGLGQEIARFMAAHGAKHILILARRTVDDIERSRLEGELGSHGAYVRIEACDITKSTTVREVAQRCLQTMPPVRGVIQAAMVLRDRILEQMSVDDFKAAVQPKVDGTIYLNEAFKGPSLDFFIMLSSVSNILGSRSQANYAAGNAFQDEFASSQNQCKTHYLSLNLGLIGDSKIMGLNPELRRNAIQAGAIPLELKQLFLLLEYAMSAQARQDKLTQVAIGFDRKSIADSQCSGLLDIPNFSHLVYESDKMDLEPVIQDSITVDKAITAAVNDDEKYSIMISAIKKQLSSLLAIDAENIDVDSPMENLGLDSLIAIELKAWVARTLQATMQTSEILDTPNIRSFITAVAKRSRFFNSYQRPQNSVRDLEGRETSENQDSTKINGQTTEHTSLPQPPLPDLESTLQFYLYSIRAFCSEEQFRKTSIAIQDFQKSGGLGSILQDRLLERAKDPGIDSWLYDLYNDHVYLKQRTPISPWGSFFGSHPPGKTSHGQAERAAIISETAFKFKQRLDAGEIEPELLNEQPLCMNTLQWLFNSIREPRTDVDAMHKFPSYDYLIAMRHGHFFKIALRKGQECVSYFSLKATYQAILDRGLEYGPSIAALTADDRDSWTEVRKIVKAVHPANESLIQMIEAAAFIICLDDGSPSTSNERSNQFWWGDISNRWSDKPLQFAICKNGVSAYICEHALIDAGTLQKLSEPLKQAITEHEPQAQYEAATNGDQATDLEEYTFVSNVEIEKHINRVQERFQASILRTEWNHFTCTDFGSAFLKSHRCGAKAGYQLVIQLASLHYFGYQPTSWETITMRAFRKGRVDIIQSVLPPVADFCAAMRNASTKATKRRELFHEASKAYTNAVTRISRGRGFAHHLYALQEVRKEDEEEPMLFKDPMYAETRPAKIMTDCVAWEGGISEGGFVMPDPEHVWVHYEIDEDGCRFSIKTPMGKAKEFSEALRISARAVKNILELE